MSGFPFPFVIVASDGRTIRTLHPAALAQHRATIEACLADLLLDPPEVVASPTPRAPKPRPPAEGETLVRREIALSQGYTGDACGSCGAFAMKRSGTCLTCDSCASTSGGCS